MEKALVTCCVALVALAFLASPAAGQSLSIYTDSLQNSFQDWSWATHNLAQTSVVHSGTSAISFVPSYWGGLAFHRDGDLDLAQYDALEFWLRGSGSGGQNVRLFATLAGGAIGGASPAAGAITAPAAWTKFRVTFAALGLYPHDVFDGILFMDQTGNAQTTIYLDDIVITAYSTPPVETPAASIAVTVDPNADRRRIDQRIYGVNFGSDSQAEHLHWPVSRWGGNSTSRYNWQLDSHSIGSDWYFMNSANDDPLPPNLPEGSESDRFIDATRAAGGEPIITVPLIGWTAKGNVKAWSFSVAKYGPQDETECSRGDASWCQPDAGNGVHNGNLITGNDPHDASVEITPTFVTDWMTHLSSRPGGNVRLFNLDNEPMLWNSTHRDVHPQGTTFDELWTKTQTYAAAIKAKDPNAQTLGPVLWGWCAYFYSGADGCGPGPDRAAHGNMDFVPWYLQQAKNDQDAHGTRLLDFLDLHFYPQANGVSLSGEGNADVQAMRLRSLKSLYDPTYNDESWIPAAINMIPRMRNWVNTFYPGTKLAITEYNWGDDGSPSAALATAEALAIFGREGLDLATVWVAPAANSRVADSFKLYLTYDGAGARVTGNSVRATSGNVNAVGAYAVRSTSGARLYVLLFNKDIAPRPVTVALAGGSPVPGTATLYRFDTKHRLAAAGTVSPIGGTLSLTLPARSATLAVVNGLPLQGTGFYPVTPCRVFDTREIAGLKSGSPILTTGSRRSFWISGKCGIPDDARVIVANATVVNGSATGDLKILAGDLISSSTSTISIPLERARANNATIQLATDGTGSISVINSSSGNVHLILDVSGYFK